MKKTRQQDPAEIIVALDVPEVEQARSLVKLLYPRITTFKVGMQLFCAGGPEMVRFITEQGARVFLDLKLYDIPNTVANAVRQAVRLDVFMLTVHIQGGPAMLQAAVEAASDEARKLSRARPLLVGITVLTSSEASPDEVLVLVQQAAMSGLDGVVCSAQEAGRARSVLPPPAVIVTPGIRLQGEGTQDQKRVATVSDAVAAGSSYLVIGRPIVASAHPSEAVDQLLKELAAVQKSS